MRAARAFSRSLEGRVALVAGATRGAGRGIACMLGEAGATVYCTGRSTRGRPPVDEKSGGVFSSWRLSDEYGFSDVDGRHPHWGRAYGDAYGNGHPPSKKIRYAWALVGNAFAGAGSHERRRQP